MEAALAGRSPECLTSSDTLVFAPGALSYDRVPASRGRKGPGLRSGLSRDFEERELYSAQHQVFCMRTNSWTDLANQMHWWKPAAGNFAVTFTTGRLIVSPPTIAATESGSETDEVDPEPRLLSGSVGQHRIKKILVTKPTEFMWNRSDIHVIADHDGESLAITVAGLEALTARRVAGRFAAAAAQRRLQEREFIEEHDAEWLETVAFGCAAALELDWAWLYELPAHH
ncbi:MAG: hypothetical protein WD602_06155 [Actinomycetota bacterium]